LLRVKISEGYWIMAIRCQDCDLPAEAIANDRPVCNKHAQQSFAPDGASLFAPDDTSGALDDSVIGALP
jgi:hypothetical protein